MITIKMLDEFISGIAKPEYSESWDNDGVLVCENINKPVKKALIMLEVSFSGVEYAVDNGFDTIITHHPFIFKPLSRITDDTYKIISLLVKNSISVLSYHTRMDAADGGVNDTAAKTIGLCEVEKFGGDNGNFGRIGKLKQPKTPSEFAITLKDTFGCGNIRASFFEDETRKIETVAVVGGAGKSFFYDAFLVGADAFVTSEVPHNTFIDAKELGMCVFDCGHYYTENAVCAKFEKLIKEKFENKIETKVFDVGSPYINI